MKYKSQEKLDFIKANYYKMRNKDISKAIGLSIRTISEYANAMGLNKTYSCMEKFNEDDNAILEIYDSMTFDEMATHLAKPYWYIRKRCNSLMLRGLVKSKFGEKRYTKEEMIETLRFNPTLSTYDLSDMFRVNACTVTRLRKELGIKGTVKYNIRSAIKAAENRKFFADHQGEYTDAEFCEMFGVGDYTLKAWRTKLKIYKDKALYETSVRCNMIRKYITEHYMEQTCSEMAEHLGITNSYLRHVKCKLKLHGGKTERYEHAKRTRHTKKNIISILKQPLKHTKPTPPKKEVKQFANLERDVACRLIVSKGDKVIAIYHLSNAGSIERYRDRYGTDYQFKVV